MSETKEVKQEGEFKLKKKTPTIKGQGNVVPEVTKIDLSKKTEEDAIQVGETEKVVDDKRTADLPKVEKEVRDDSGEITKVDLKEKVESPLELVEDEDDNSEEVTMVGGTESPNTSQEQKEVLPQAQTQDYPENVDKLIEFMKETGGTIDDYARLNADYSNVDGEALLREYYKQAKPHLDSEEIQFVIEDSFSFDEDLDEARDIRKKKLAYKEEVAKAKSYLDSLKDKYYAEIKLRPGVNQEQQKAMDFFNRYNEEQELSKVNQNRFHAQTDELLNNEFKGFDFKVGDKKYRYNVKDAAATKDYQSDISNFVREFLDENDMMKDAAGYHKALYAGRNIDKIVSHFYEQGKADAIKNTAIKSKNIDMDPRTVKPVVNASGMKVKVLGGEDSSRLKFKIRKK